MRILLLLIVFLSGCTSVPGSGLGGKLGTPFVGFEPPLPNNAHIYVYRPEKFFWFKAYPNVSIDGQIVGELRNGTYIVAQVPPGEHTITVHGNGYWSVPDSTKVIDIQSQESIFLRVEAQLENLLQLVMVSLSAGLMMESTGFGMIHEEDFEGVASSSLAANEEENMLAVFKSLLISNKYYFKEEVNGVP